MTPDQEKQWNELTASIRETNDDKMLYATIVGALIKVSGYNTKPKALKEKADDLFYGIKNKPYQY